MPDTTDVLWFKQQFQPRILPALEGTPLSVDMIAAIACQETGPIWSLLRRKALPVAQILALCVGDTLDGNKGRSAFPRSKAELLSRPRGDQMFRIARQALLAMAAQVPGFGAAVALPDKFCHGFGIFQRDIQFFVSDPDYFLQRRYEDFDQALAQCVGELRLALRKLGLQGRASLSALELAAVGIAYNCGSFNQAKGLRQGYFDGSRYYGELIYGYIQLAQATPWNAAPLAAPVPSIAPATTLSTVPSNAPSPAPSIATSMAPRPVVISPISTSAPVAAAAAMPVAAAASMPLASSLTSQLASPSAG